MVFQDSARTGIYGKSWRPWESLRQVASIKSWALRSEIWIDLRSERKAQRFQNVFKTPQYASVCVQYAICKYDNEQRLHWGFNTIQTWILPTTQRLSHPNVKIPVKTVKKIELFALNKLHRMSRSLVWLRSLVELLETEGRRRSWNEGDYSGFVMICWSNVDWLLHKQNARNTPSQGVARFRHFRDFITVRGRLWRLWQWFRHDFGIYGLSVVTGHVDTRSFGFQNDFSRVCNAREVSLRILANGEFRSDLPRRPRFRSTHDNLMIINGYGGNSSRRFGNPWERQWKPSQRDWIFAWQHTR